MGHATGVGHPTLGDRRSGAGIPVTPTSPLMDIFDLKTSFGHGQPGVDDAIPEDDNEGESFWFSPTLDADHATADQVREWPVVNPLSHLHLIVRIDRVALNDTGARLVVTVDGVDTAIAVDLPKGLALDFTLEDEADIAVAETSKVGVRFDPGEDLASGYLRCEARLLGRWSGVTPTPAPPALEGALWVAADFGVATTGGAPPVEGDPVVFWYDKDPLHQNLTDTVVPPVYRENAVNGLPAVEFFSDVIAVDNGLGIPTNLLRALATPFASGDPRYIFAVFVPKSWVHGISSGDGGGIMQFRGVNQTVFKCEAFNWNNDSLFHAYDNGGGVIRTAATQAAFANIAQLYEWSYDGTDLTLYRNGVAVTLDDPNANPADNSATAGFYLGRHPTSGAGAVGEALFCELRVFSGIPSAADLAAFRAYLVGKWGVP